MSPFRRVCKKTRSVPNLRERQREPKGVPMRGLAFLYA